MADLKSATATKRMIVGARNGKHHNPREIARESIVNSLRCRSGGNQKLGCHVGRLGVLQQNETLAKLLR